MKTNANNKKKHISLKNRNSLIKLTKYIYVYLFTSSFVFLLIVKFTRLFSINNSDYTLCFVDNSSIYYEFNDSQLTYIAQPHFCSCITKTFTSRFLYAISDTNMFQVPNLFLFHPNHVQTAQYLLKLGHRHCHLNFIPSDSQ